MKNIKTLLRSTVLITSVLAIFIPSVVLADDFSGSTGDVCSGIGVVSSSQPGGSPAAGATPAANGGCGSNSTSDLDSILSFALNLLSIIVGIVSVIMIVVGGFKFVLSGGDSAQVSGARNTVLFALVGLVVVALAQIIVRFVLANVTKRI